jgi:hypothetical protein
MVISSERALAPPISRRLLTVGRDVLSAIDTCSPGQRQPVDCSQPPYPDLAVARFYETNI